MTPSIDTVCLQCGYTYGAHRQSDDRCPIVQDGIVTGFTDAIWTPPLDDREEDDSE